MVRRVVGLIVIHTVAAKHSYLSGMIPIFSILNTFILNISNHMGPGEEKTALLQVIGQRITRSQ